MDGIEGQQRREIEKLKAKREILRRMDMLFNEVGRMEEGEEREAKIKEWERLKAENDAFD